MDQERAAARAKLRARQPTKRSRRGRLLLLAFLVLLWALLRACDCDEAPPSPPPTPPLPPTGGVLAVEAVPAPPKAAPVPKSRARPRHGGRIEPRERPRYQNEAPPVQSWLTDFRMQVAARSPRLSRCFEGAQHPGAIKWTVTMDVANGIVSDHAFDPVLEGATMSRAMKVCLANVLALPPYGFTPRGPIPSPSRVSMVIEF